MSALPISIVFFGYSVEGGTYKRIIRLVDGLSRYDDAPAFAFVTNRSFVRAVCADSELSQRWERIRQAAGMELHVLPDLGQPYRKLTTLMECLQLGWVAARSGIGHYHLFFNAIRAAWLLKALGRRVLAEVPGHNDVRSCSSGWDVRVYSSMDMYHCVSPRVAAALTERLREVGRPRSQETIFVNPLPFFDACRRRQAAPKEKLVVFAARLVQSKNPLVFAEAARDVLEKFPDWRIALLGDGPLRVDVDSVLKRHLEAGRAVTGYSPNVSGYLDRSAIFVSVIEHDNYPSQSVLEAMAACNYLILSDRGQSHRFVGADNGVLIEPSVCALSAALQRSMSEYQRTVTRGQSSRILLENRFSAELYLKEFVGMWRKFISV